MRHVVVSQILRVAIFAAATTMCAGLFSQKNYGGMHPQEVLTNSRNNAQNTTWGRQQRDAAVAAAAKWMALSDEAVWAMIPGQALPRCIDVTWDYDYPSQPRLGCLNCGDAIHNYGNYPYNPDIWNKPWKLTCPNCNWVFPTNDFGAYYRSGINSQGLFDPAVADRTLLYNTAHPSPTDPLHKFGVDDGYGYVDANGREHKFIAYYTWKYWREIWAGVLHLSNAYLLTGDKAYARKAAIMLDRIADVYPAMDWAPYANRGWYHSDGGSKKGKIEGRIWETQTVQNFSRAYDRIISGTFDNPQLYSFLQQKDQQFTLPGDKGSREALIANIDQGILVTAANAIKSQQIWGNEGMHQLSMTMAALAMNQEPQTGEWLDWLFASNGGKIPTQMVQLFDRDGMANEAAPGYNYIWPPKYHEIARLLERYPSYSNNDIGRDFPWFRNASRAPWKAQLLKTFTPNIGDTGATGLIAMHFSPGILAAGFEIFGDHAAARYAWEANGNSASGLLVDIGSTTPEALNNELELAALNYPQEPGLGENMAGYGLASVEFGGDSLGKGLWCYYGRTTGHGHADRLNFGLYAFNTDLTPDLGYPEYANSTWHPRLAWNDNTISHNTVIVDKAPQRENWTGYPRFFTTSPGFGAFEIESRNVYTQCSEYARTMAFIQAPDGSNAYAVDVFRVTGGADHLMSFHGPPGAVTASGVTFTSQATGTYAGENVAYGNTSSAYPLGYSYLKNVEWNRQPPAQFSLNWKAEAGYRGVTSSDNIHLRMHVLSQLDDIALADGVPAQNKAGNPEKIRYALLHRGGKGAPALDTQFISVLEPWKSQTFLTSLARVTLNDPQTTDVVALRVGIWGGYTDYIISNPLRRMVQVPNGPTTDGVLAWMRIKDGRMIKGSLTRGTVLSYNDRTLEGPGDISGQLISFNKDVRSPADAWLNVTQGDPRNIAGSQIIFNNDRVRNACYDIEQVQQAGSAWKITCGATTFVRGFVDASNYSKGYVYNIADGNSFYVPVTTTYTEPAADVNGWAPYEGD